jgi:transglutaminase-like putative cysteine protease
VTTVPELPENARRLDTWLPIPSSDDQQIVSEVRVDTTLAHEFQTDPDEGNCILHVWTDRSERATITLRFDCTRLEEHALAAERRENVSTAPTPGSRQLQPDRLGVIDDRIRSLAARITAGRPDALSKARAIYDYVIGHVTYDKVTPGWGRGDTLRVCKLGKGNCTDFSALFISLSRASGIPARFKIGCQVPRALRAGPIAGYHCWVEFWAPGIGWVPVDASEAWKDPARREFYFGSLDCDRFQFSLGRDVRLPGAQGESQNYFFAPAAEVDGKPIAVERSLLVTTRQ